jgi:uncharacterized protein YycO
VKILLFKGKSLISRLIQWQTRSPYSHVAVQLNDGRIVEAWHIGGVGYLTEHTHTPKTEIDVFKIEGEYNILAVEKFLSAQIGKKYDFRSVFRFVSRRDAPADDRWFCSELVVTAFYMGGLDLLRGAPSMMSPRDIAMIPRLQFERTVEIEELMK